MRLKETRELMLKAGPILDEIQRESSEIGIPSIDPEDGITLMIEAYRQALQGGKLMLDLGAGIGYSTAWIALGTQEGCTDGGCKIIAVEYDPARASRIKGNLDRLGLTRVEIEVKTGEAIHVLEGLENSSIALAFVDIEKHQYLDALKLLETKLKPWGAALFHNAFFPAPPEEFFLAASNKPWKSTILPTPAGMLVAYRERSVSDK